MPDKYLELMQAISSKNTSLAKEILSTNPSVERRNEKGFNSLQISIKNNMTEICEDILSRYKSKIFLSDNLTRDVLHLAIKQSNIRIIKMLVDKIGVEKITSPLYLTEAKRFIKTDKGRDVYDYLNSIIIQNLSIISLIELNIDLDVILKRIEKDEIKIDYSILTTVITYKGIEYFIPLYNIAKKQGLDVNGFVPGLNWTMLYDAIYENNINIVKFLCEDPDIDVDKGSEIDTPFYMACDSYRDNVLNFLINRGANLNTKPDWGKPALYHLMIHGFESTMIRDIVAKGLNANEIHREDNILQFFVKYVYHIHIHDDDYINLLISYVDINHKDSIGDTSLINAVKKGYDDIAEALIEAGADITIKNIHNKSVYDYADDFILKMLPEQKGGSDILYEEDPRIFTKDLKLKVFDIINFEEVNLNEFITNKENIIYFIRDESNNSLSLYGITRKDLRKCSKNDENRCTFPTGHTINVDEAFKFMIEDFTLFQITKKNVKCFTCQKFEDILLP